jgi:hypothetical protein
MDKNTWISALASQSIIFTISIIVDLVLLFREKYSEHIASLVLLFALFLVIPLCVFSILFATMIHYECWKVLPSGYRNQITPEKAIGFLFIPFYNFYWFFISYPCLASGYYRCGQQNNISEIKNQRGLAIAYAILSVCNIVFIFIPVLRSTTLIAGFVIFVLFYNRIISYANLASNMQSKI